MGRRVDIGHKNSTLKKVFLDSAPVPIIKTLSDDQHGGRIKSPLFSGRGFKDFLVSFPVTSHTDKLHREVKSMLQTSGRPYPPKSLSTANTPSPHTLHLII